MVTARGTAPADVLLKSAVSLAIAVGLPLIFAAVAVIAMLSYAHDRRWWYTLDGPHTTTHSFTPSTVVLTWHTATNSDARIAVTAILVGLLWAVLSAAMVACGSQMYRVREKQW